MLMYGALGCSIIIDRCTKGQAPENLGPGGSLLGRITGTEWSLRSKHPARTTKKCTDTSSCEPGSQALKPCRRTAKPKFSANALIKSLDCSTPQAVQHVRGDRPRFSLGAWQLACSDVGHQGVRAPDPKLPPPTYNDESTNGKHSSNKLHLQQYYG